MGQGQEADHPERARTVAQTAQCLSDRRRPRAREAQRLQACAVRALVKPNPSWPTGVTAWLHQATRSPAARNRAARPPARMGARAAYRFCGAARMTLVG